MKQSVRKWFLLLQYEAPYSAWVIIAKTPAQAETEGERYWRTVAGARPLVWTMLPLLPPRHIPGTYEVDHGEAWLGSYPDLEIPYRPEFNG